MKVRLDIWLQRNFDPPPDIRNAKLWIKQGRIYPPPIKMGRSYYVEQDAAYVDYFPPPAPSARGDTKIPILDRIRLDYEDYLERRRLVQEEARSRYEKSKTPT